VPAGFKNYRREFLSTPSFPGLTVDDRDVTGTVATSTATFELTKSGMVSSDS